MAIAACTAVAPSITTPPPVQSIEITPTNPRVAAGTSMQLTATAIYSDNSHTDVTTQVAWSASNTAIATRGSHHRYGTGL